MAYPNLLGYGIGTRIAALAANVMAIGMHAIKTVHSMHDPSGVAYIKLRTEEGDFVPTLETPGRKHGVIVLGDGGRWARTSLENTSGLVYRTLIERGYEKDDLYVLKGTGKPSERVGCHTLPSSKRHLTEVLNHLYRSVASDDAFFICVLAHGWNTGLILPTGQSAFLFSDTEAVTDKELEELLSDLHPSHTIAYFNSCYSGGFAKRLGKGRTIGVSTSRSDKGTGGYMGKSLTRKYGEHAGMFSFYFFSALRHQLPDGMPISQTCESIEDAFNYAAQKQYESPESSMGAWFKSTPHLVYGRIDPQHVRL